MSLWLTAAPHLFPAARRLEQDIDEDEVDKEDEDGQHVNEYVPAGPVCLGPALRPSCRCIVCGHLLTLFSLLAPGRRQKSLLTASRLSRPVNPLVLRLIGIFGTENYFLIFYPADPSQIAKKSRAVIYSSVFSEHSLSEGQKIIEQNTNNSWNVNTVQLTCHPFLTVQVRIMDNDGGRKKVKAPAANDHTQNSTKKLSSLGILLFNHFLSWISKICREVFEFSLNLYLKVWLIFQET